MRKTRLLSLAIVILLAAIVGLVTRCYALTLPPSTVGRPQEPRNHPKSDELICKFADEEFPKGFKDKEKLASLLQLAVNKIYPTGFRYLGNKEDFFHEHVLYTLDDRGVPRAVAILYHTQEEAARWHKLFPHGTYDYLDCQTRNWIQWLDRPEVVENANQYERTTYPTGLDSFDQEKWESFIELSLPMQKQNFTIKEWMLDPEFFGGEIAFSVNIRFYEVAGMPEDPSMNVIAITLPKEKKPVYLALKITRTRSNGELVRKSYDTLLYNSTLFEKYLY